MQKKETFGQILRGLREQRGIPLRKVAAELDIDPSTLSKIERGERSANREHIKVIAQLFEVSEKELLVSFLSDKVSIELVNEECFHEILQVAEVKIRYQKQRKQKQGTLNI
jgi:transcriptional regulator with XRE-family HTH domain